MKQVGGNEKYPCPRCAIDQACVAKNMTAQCRHGLWKEKKKEKEKKSGKKKNVDYFLKK